MLRRKEPSHLGDIGVTEVNKNVAAAWSSTSQLSHAGAANRCTQTLTCTQISLSSLEKSIPVRVVFVLELRREGPRSLVQVR